ncbi:MAG: alpha/beta hydrolase [Gammaproteobacteria bacterium]
MPLAPEYQAMLAAAAAQPGPALSSLPASAGREMYRMMRPANPAIAVGAVSDRTIPGPAGDIPVRVYRPTGDGPFPVFVNFHGGGWVIGDLDTADAFARDLCQTVGCVVVSVDYRMAPEALFPAAVDDCVAATQWVASHQAKLDGNGRLAVGGESAGGNLAPVVAQIARDSGGPRIDLQVLLYPVTDADLTRASYDENGTGYLLERATMAWFWDTYCPDVALRSDPRAAPIRASSLAGLPHALVVTAEFDPLRDEGEAYGRALLAAGSSAELRRFDGLVHDFCATAQVFSASRAAFMEICSHVRARLHG